MAVGYSNYVNSFYCNDVNILKKRQKQAKVVGKTAAVAGAALAGLSILNRCKPVPALLSLFAFYGAYNSLNYSKQAQEKINQLEANA